jgi:1,4-dihydroxy-2-naphthoate octaprenyltransferase
MMNKTQAWLHAFRLRTLPLALSSIIMASMLAAAVHSFSWSITILAALTTLHLQILSNLSNDYGDSESGIDNEERVGPARAVQSGLISADEMKQMMVVFASLALVSGLMLVYQGTKHLEMSYGLVFIMLGVAAITAAIKYTVGKNPYGYRGLGDFYVFVFFGIIGTLGTYFLQTSTLPFSIVFPAISVGLLSVGVLNVNNMRDIINDENSGKRTIVVMLGSRVAKIYHLLLISIALLSALLYIVSNYTSLINFLFLLAFVPLAFHIRRVWANNEPALLDPEMKILALSTLLFSLLLGLGFIL